MPEQQKAFLIKTFASNQIDRSKKIELSSVVIDSYMSDFEINGGGVLGLQKAVEGINTLINGPSRTQEPLSLYNTEMIKRRLNDNLKNMQELGTKLTNKEIMYKLGRLDARNNMGKINVKAEQNLITRYFKQIEELAQPFDDAVAAKAKSLNINNLDKFFNNPALKPAIDKVKLYALKTKFDKKNKDPQAIPNYFASSIPLLVIEGLKDENATNSLLGDNQDLIDLAFNNNKKIISILKLPQQITGGGKIAPLINIAADANFTGQQLDDIAAKNPNLKDYTQALKNVIPSSLIHIAMQYELLKKLGVKEEDIPSKLEAKINAVHEQLPEIIIPNPNPTNPNPNPKKP
jgi:hypothetical protein